MIRPDLATRNFKMLSSSCFHVNSHARAEHRCLNSHSAGHIIRSVSKHHVGPSSLRRDVARRAATALSPPNEADVIVVGAGVAGLVAAKNLVKAGMFRLVQSAL